MAATIVDTDTSTTVEFLNDNEEIVVDPHVLIGTANEPAVLSTHKNSKLVNHGIIYAAPDQDAVDFNGGGGTNSSITNAANGQISATFGVFVDNPDTDVINKGSITAYDGFAVQFEGASGGGTLNNSGSIFGHDEGVELHSITGKYIITNSGTITSDDTAVYILPSGSATVTIVNNAASVMRGAVAAVTLQSGALVLTNHGTIFGDITNFGSGHETITNDGTIHGNVGLGGGKDVYNGASGHSGLIFGNGGDDTITGGAGADVISGGKGNDTLTGGGNEDHFTFDAKLNADTNVDTITDFQPGIDKIDLAAVFFTKVSGTGDPGNPLVSAEFVEGDHATKSAQRIIYDPANGWVSYDPDGKGSHAAVHFATLAENLTLHATDFDVLLG